MKDSAPGTDRMSPDVLDMIRTDRGTTLDSDTLLRETQTRIWRSLKEGYEYDNALDGSEKFLRNNVLKRFKSVVLYVDLVGSTQLALDLPEEKLAMIISTFAQEMANTIRAYRGLALKFVGDAVIGYFVASGNSLLAADRAVSCAKSMLTIMHKGINPILTQYDYPELRVKIGMDFGENIVVMYGNKSSTSQVDLIGRSMNMAAKIQGMAKPDQILVGEHVYIRLHPATQEEFDLVVWKNNVWTYHAVDTGNLYKVYRFTGS